MRTPKTIKIDEETHQRTKECIDRRSLSTFGEAVKEDLDGAKGARTMKVCSHENVPDHVKIRLEAEGHEVESARAIAGQATPDKELLKLGAQEQWVLLTNDGDFD